MNGTVATPAQRLLINECLDNGVHFLWRGAGTLVVAQSGLAAILERLVQGGVVVLGFDGFEMEGAELHPRLDLIFDASRRPDADPVQALSAWPADAWIDVALRVPDPSGHGGLPGG